MTLITRSLVSAVASMAITAAAPAGPVLHVDDDAAPQGDGEGWDTAYRFLQDALGHAADPDNGVIEIRVAGGTYRPDRNEASPDGNGDRLASFPLISGVGLRGGYAGIGAPDPDARDPDLHVTVLSGDLAGDDAGLANNGENSLHVLVGAGLGPGTGLDGFTVTGGNANLHDELPAEGGGVYLDGGLLTVGSCRFRYNAAGAGSLAGGAFACTQAVVSFTECAFDDNVGEVHGGALLVTGGEVALTDCAFRDNVAAVGAGVRGNGGASVLLTRCVFERNNTEAAGPAVFMFGPTLRAIDCVFADNESSLGIGAVGGTIGQAEIVNSQFLRNRASDIGGGLEVVGSVTLINTVFSRNLASYGGGAFLGGPTSIVNCTFANNAVSGVALDSYHGSAEVVNTILWGNGTSVGPDPGDGVGFVAASYSNVEGGWEGEGNLDADPLFVQPGMDDVRLTFDSPCLDAGNTSALPADEHDLDGDGDTVEPLPVDVLGNPRVQGSAVDMGAYEGAFEPASPADGVGNLDQGDFVVLVPAGIPYAPVQAAAVIVTNTAGPDNATFVVTETSSAQPSAGGYSELATVLTTETSLADGQFLALLSIPFDAAHLGGAEPADVNVTYYDPAVGNWALAVAGNTAPSPGFAGPVGDRNLSLWGGGYLISNQLGDHGVYWDPALQRGFAWAAVDHVGEFAVGVPLCPADCRQSPDGVVGVEDFLALLSAWGIGGPCDLDGSGLVGQTDLGALLAEWGACAQPVSAGWTSRRVEPRDADLDGDGRVGGADLQALRATWGPCAAPCPEDLDGDGRVSVSDHLQLLASWAR